MFHFLQSYSPKYTILTSLLKLAFFFKDVFLQLRNERKSQATNFHSNLVRNKQFKFGALLAWRSCILMNWQTAKNTGIDFAPLTQFPKLCFTNLEAAKFKKKIA